MVRLSIVNVTKLLLSLHNFPHLLFGHTHCKKKKTKNSFFSTNCCSMSDPSEVPAKESTRIVPLFVKDLWRLNLPLLKLFILSL